ncbi:uncharacterized protein VTP21DRAFT_9018 [Calcarisporiella thermophila]|uniref:uncharacterized protein n=1 Tax=Calcarisporiella thermophila TaxID=911321 RepID=UPI0037435A8D
MNSVLALLLVAFVLRLAMSATVVDFYGSSGERTRLSYGEGESKPLNGGWLHTNLCRISVPPPGNGECRFYFKTGGQITLRAGQSANVQSQPPMVNSRCWSH